MFDEERAYRLGRPKHQGRVAFRTLNIRCNLDDGVAGQTGERTHWNEVAGYPFLMIRCIMDVSASHL
jgi:hypothetical protein